MTTSLTPLDPAPAPANGAGHTGRRTGRAWWNTLAICAPTALLVVLGYLHRWVADDGLIYTRAVRQILAGHGPRFNLTERAESSTGTLWQWLLVAMSLTSGADPALVAMALGLLCTTAGLLLALDGTRRFHLRAHGGRTALLPAGVLVLLPVQAMWDYSTCGLETGLVFGWLGLCWWLLVRAADGMSSRALSASAVAIGLGPLVRPDLALVSAVFLGCLWSAVRPGRRATLRWLAAASALPLGYEIFRAGYYGILVPLPGITKEASASLWGRGLLYLENFVEPYRLWAPLALMVVLAGVVTARRAHHRHELVIIAAPLLSGLLSALYEVKVGGDFMHGRTLLPALFLVLLPLMLVPVSRSTAAVVAALGVWAGGCLLLWRPPLMSDPTYRIYDERAFYIGTTGNAHPDSQRSHAASPSALTDAVDRAQRQGGGRLLLHVPGLRGYTALPLARRFGSTTGGAETKLGHSGTVVPLDGPSVDPLGLAYPLAAHLDQFLPGKAGHNKRIPVEWIIADYTDPDVRLPAGVDTRRVAAARHALTCGRLAELQESVRAPMTPDRFRRNLLGAWGRTAFRLPADPLTAERRLCVPQEVSAATAAVASESR